MSLVVLVPCLARPQNVAPLLEAFHYTTPGARVLFITDPDDTAERDAITAAGGEMITPGGTYAQKINVGVRSTTENLLLFGADDIKPHSGWFGQALDKIHEGAQVVGLNDLIPRRRRPEHATHFLVTRQAAELPCIDGSPGPLYEGYAHWRTDDEYIATAAKRGHYAYATAAVVEHVNHPMTGGPDDDTYRKGRASARVDGKRFMRRAHLWT